MIKYIVILAFAVVSLSACGKSTNPKAYHERSQYHEHGRKCSHNHAYTTLHAHPEGYANGSCSKMNKK